MMRTLWLLVLATISAQLAAAQPAKPTAEEVGEIRLLIAELEAFRGDDRIVAAKSLAKFGPKAKEAVPKLIERVGGDLTESGQRSALEALAKIGDERALPALRIAARRGVTAANRRVAEEILAVMHPQALYDARIRLGIDGALSAAEIAQSLRLHAKATPEERMQAFKYMTDARNAKALPEAEVAGMLDDLHPEFRNSAADLLIWTNPSFACGEPVRRLNAKPDTATDSPSKSYAAALAVLERKAAKLEPARLAEIRESTKHSDAGVRSAAIGFLSRGKSSHTIALETWKIWFADRSPAICDLASDTFLALHSDEAKLQPDVRDAICELASHSSVRIRKRAIEGLSRPERAAAIPLENWKRWVGDESEEVRATAVCGLLARGDKDRATASILDGLKRDPSEKVKAALEGHHSFGEAANRLAVLIREDTDSIAYLRLRTLSDLLSVKKHALTPIKEYFKTVEVLQKFKFDPASDVHGLMLTYSAKKPELSGLALCGQFKKDKPNEVVEVAVAGRTGAAVVVDDSSILTAESKDSLAELRKPRLWADLAKLPLAKVVPKDPDRYLAWAVAKPSLIGDSDLPKFLGITGEWEKLHGVVAGIEVDGGNWKVVLALPAADKESAESWMANLQKALATLVAFLPVIGANQPDFKEALPRLVSADRREDHSGDTPEPIGGDPSQGSGRMSFTDPKGSELTSSTVGSASSGSAAG